jgi:hypothetical protein
MLYHSVKSPFNTVLKEKTLSGDFSLSDQEYGLDEISKESRIEARKNLDNMTRSLKQKTSVRRHRYVD